MASSVSSEHTFSSAGITISKRHNQLHQDIVEGLQFIKCWFHCDLIFCENPIVESEQSSGEPLGNTTGWDEKVLENKENDDEMDFKNRC